MSSDKTAAAEVCACGAPLAECMKCGDSRCLTCDPYSDRDTCAGVLSGRRHPIASAARTNAAPVRELDSADRRVASIIYTGIAKAYGADRPRCPECGGNEQSCQCALEDAA